ncbi:stabilin-2 isoform X3 [Betta splendens]|uniref:Stabilin-2 isoform X3 n=1 Tax=Betta splendens TaxID=158456 RepID=A0A6P7NHU5_BETSP|nr:stabilin-2 isoform X3 [Betta splendens]
MKLHGLNSLLVSLPAMTVMMMIMMKAPAASQQNFCLNSTVLRTWTACHSCRITALIQCPLGFRRTLGAVANNCSYHVRTASLKITLSGCSFECYREEEVKSCCPGYWGPDCVECPDQAHAPCSNRGVCSDGLGGNGTCACQVGFTGTACEDCSPDRYGSTCTSECTCVHGLCNSGLKGDGRCTCFSGYKGPNCDQELPECAALGCQQNARCMEQAVSGRLVCECLPGYQRSADQCLSVNPCLQSVCHARASCLHTGPNQHRCVCKEGYSGDGRVCVSIDPCQTGQGGCSESTRCVYDGPGQSHCECLPGFEKLLNGVCSVRDSCRPDSCHQNANCTTVGPGRVQCTCLQGYVGSGKVCYGNLVQRLNELNTDPRGQWTGQLSNAIALFASISWPLQNLGPFTVFVPINRGFKDVSVRTLAADVNKAKYLCKLHLVAGVVPSHALRSFSVFYTLTGKSAETEVSEDKETRIRIHGSRQKGSILQSDLVASNGMIHIISKLMDSVSPTVESDPEENLMKIISNYDKFDKFRSLLEKTDLAPVVDLPGPITAFAPCSAAFEAMAAGHLQYLSSSDGRNKLLELMRNHVVPSTSLDVLNLVSSPRIVTMANQVLTVNVTENGQILVDGAAVLEAAVQAKNGRLYVLDRVLVPASIQPVLPHRCDLSQRQIVESECVSCSKLQVSRCPSGSVHTGSSFGCLYLLSTGDSRLMFPAKGCSLLCNTTVTTPACCAGFYGPDCSPCPGGFQSPCSGHGQCVEGIKGNGSCICDPNFSGSRCQYCASSTKYGPKCDRTCPCVHGQCESRPDSDGRCKPDSCQQGFTGRFCERKTAACGARIQFCHAHADCDFSQTSPRCVCKPGYQGDGITCVESDPCAPPLRGGCSVNAKCVQTGPATHTCQCLRGWREDGDDCQPINNCNSPDRGGCHPSATCIYIGPGQSDCSCKLGYKGNGFECEAVNQCVTADGGCHYWASCLLRSSQWTCVCDEGYVGDGRACYGSVEQGLMALPDASDFSGWVTDSGMSESLLDQNITLLVPSSAAVAKMSSEDKSFWTMKGNLPSLIRNHMIPGNVPLSFLSNVSSLTSLLKTTLPVRTDGNQLTDVGGAAVTMSNIPATNGLIHVIDKVLVPDRKLSEGLLAMLSLRPEFSLFRSYLINYNLTEEIERASEFTVFAPTDGAIKHYLSHVAADALDINTTRYHVILAQRLLKTDLQLSGYKQTMLGFSFQLGFFPRDGKLFVNDALLNSTNILSGKGVIHGLSAVLEINWNRCDQTSYQKLVGACEDCLLPRRSSCLKGTDPDFSVARKKCMYLRMFEGERLLISGCRTTCLRPKVEARCCGGYFGEHCEPCPGPKGKPCYGNGACLDGTRGTGVCLCNRGFNGTACETCEGGKYGVHCDQDCHCQNGRCSDGVRGDGTCECDVGWRGVFCDESKSLSEPDPALRVTHLSSHNRFCVRCLLEVESRADQLCGSFKCHTSANCVFQTSGPRCLCAAGFEGDGTVCEAKDPCLVDNGGCSPDGVCKRTRPGRRDCVCNSGFSGDGLVCVGINPCLEGNGGCHVHADCVHVGPNRTSCACKEGYSGDGSSCEMINLCLKRNGGCHRKAWCNMTGPGAANCTCNNGFVGDGLVCRGTVMQELLTRKLGGFQLGLMDASISLSGRGPFTVFVPSSRAYRNVNVKMRTLLRRNREKFASVLRSHIVMGHTLLPADLNPPRNLTTLSGLVLTTGSRQGVITVNEANVTYSDGVSTNGILHEINRVLFLPDVYEDKRPLNLSDVADGYRTFYKLLEDTGVMKQLNDRLLQPVTVFMPSDGVMAALPQEQRDFLFHQHNRAQLVEYLKYHVLQKQMTYAEGLVHLDSAQTLQGSSLSFSAGSSDSIGEIFVNDGNCRIVQRHLAFSHGMAYGIDCLLTPPSLGGRCDQESTFELRMSCEQCKPLVSPCPKGAVVKEIEKCDLPSMFVGKNLGCRGVCTVLFWQPKCCRGYFGRDCLVCPGGVGSVCSGRGKCDDGHLGNGTCTCETGFGGVACELCSDGFYGPTCRACNCSEHGSCDDGRRGTGQCFCEPGWTGDRCDTPQAEIFTCSPPCSPKAVCQDNNTCVCRPFYDGDGVTCAVVDMCQVWNGGCAEGAKCSQDGERVSCTCPKGHTGDGFSCQPIDPCASGDNGGCHEHATCTMTAPGKKRCACKDAYIGDGVSCEVKQLPVSRCLQDNGQCHEDAKCTDLHFEDATLGVFHHRSDKGQYKLTFAAAEQACIASGGALATYTQLSYAQQGGLNMCAAGWLHGARVAYPTTYSNPKCGFGHVGIVDYGVRKNLSEAWDAFCYWMKEVRCECRPGYVGNGVTCTGNLLQVLRSTPTFSSFLTQVLNYSEASDSGRRFVRRLSNLTVQSTLFVPDNSGLAGNQTLSQRDVEFHLSEGQALPLSQLKNGSRIRTRVGVLTVVGVADLLDPTALSSRYINGRFVTSSDILASNGIIHVLQAPLKAPPPKQQMPVAHRAGTGVGVVLLVLLLVGAGFVGYHFYRRSTKPFRFHYFKDDEEEEEASAAHSSRSISNPVYEAASEPAESSPSHVAAEDKHEVVNGGTYDLLQDS